MLDQKPDLSKTDRIPKFRLGTKYTRRILESDDRVRTEVFRYVKFIVRRKVC